MKPAMTAALLTMVLTLARAADGGALPRVPPLPAPSTAGAAQLSTAAVVARMQKNYDAARDFRARFSQKVVSIATAREKVATGELAFKKPGLMRMDYQQPEPKMFLANGQDFWMYEPEDKQAFKQDLKSSQLPAALAFLMGQGKLSDEFEITPATDVAYGRRDQYKLALKPKKPQSTYKSIFFIVDPKSFFVVESVLVNAQGDINHFTFTDLKVNTKVPDATFKWTPPPGVKRIDTATIGR